MIRDRFAMGMTKFFRFIADTFFAKRYGHRAVVLETIAGVPGLVAGMWIHLKSLRQMKTGYETCHTRVTRRSRERKDALDVLH